MAIIWGMCYSLYFKETEGQIGKRTYKYLQWLNSKTGI